MSEEESACDFLFAFFDCCFSFYYTFNIYCYQQMTSYSNVVCLYSINRKLIITYVNMRKRKNNLNLNKRQYGRSTLSSLPINGLKRKVKSLSNTSCAHLKFRRAIPDLRLLFGIIFKLPKK